MLRAAGEEEERAREAAVAMAKLELENKRKADEVEKAKAAADAAAAAESRSAASPSSREEAPKVLVHVCLRLTNYFVVCAAFFHLLELDVFVSRREGIVVHGAPVHGSKADLHCRYRA